MPRFALIRFLRDLYREWVHRLRNVAVAVALAPILASQPTWGTESETVSQLGLLADLHELTRTIEDSHPDPFQRCGGRIAFYRKASGIQEGIPTSGMAPDDFLRLVRPLVALVGDGHTFLDSPHGDGKRLPRLWLDVEAVDVTLWVAGVHREEDRLLLGGRLVSLERTRLEDITSRMSERQGHDNVYNNLDHVVTSIEKGDLGDLLNAPISGGRVRVEVAFEDAPNRVQAVPFSVESPGPPIAPASRIRLPEPNAADIAWGFLGGGTDVAILRIDSMMRYREAFEIWRSVGLSQPLGKHLTETVRRSTGGRVPETEAGRIAAVPSACETFRDLLAAIRRAGTRHLIVDLRRNQGGCSDIESMLEYFLYGWDALIDADRGYRIRRDSSLLARNYGGAASESNLEDRAGGYNFSGERKWEQRRQKGLTPDERARARAGILAGGKRAPTFERFLREDQGGWGAGLDVIVLTSARTYSAGFDMTAMLFRHGAKIVGVPSSQAPNCFIDSLAFELPHSRLKGSVSFKRSLLFPNAPSLGRLLRPDVELTYDTLAAMDFDPNASVRLALDHLARNATGVSKDEGATRLIWSGDLDGALPLLRQRYRLDEVVRGKDTELDRITALRDWAHGRWRHHSWNEPERFDALSILSDADRGQRFRCVEYALVLAQVYRAMGWRARFARVQGEGGAHAVTEVFSRQLGKWILMDGQTAAHVELDGTPLNLEEIRAARAAQKQLFAVGPGQGSRYLDWLSSMLDFIMVSRDCSYGRELDALLVFGASGRSVPRDKPRYLRGASYIEARGAHDIYPPEELAE